MPKLLPFLCLALLPPLSSLAQEPPQLPPPSSVQEMVREWIRVQTLAREEEIRWIEERQSLLDLNHLRRQELTQLEEVIAASEARSRDFAARQDALTQEQTALRTHRDLLLNRIAPLEARVRGLLASFPPPLQEKLQDTAARLTAPPADHPLQLRYREILTVLTEAGNFDRELTLHTERRRIEGREIELEVLYLGLARAFYVDPTGRFAGTGVPGPQGWVWTATPSLGPEIRRTIAIHRQEAPPALVRLPIQITE